MCRSRRELSNEYLLAKFGFDTAESEPCKVCPLSAYRSPRYPLVNIREILVGKDSARFLESPTASTVREDQLGCVVDIQLTSGVDEHVLGLERCGGVVLVCAVRVGPVVSVLDEPLRG